MNYAASLHRLLRCVHQPKVLERDNFGLALKQALGAASVYDALALCVDGAFSADGSAWSVHRSILRRFTLDQHVPRYRAAGELGISPRRFYYLQAEAVEFVAAYAQTLLRTQGGAASFDDIAGLLMESDPARAVPLIGSQTAALYAHVVSTPYRFELPPVFQTYKAADAGLACAFYALRSEYRGERDEALARLEQVRAARFDHLGHASRLTDLAVSHVCGVMARHDGDAEGLASAARRAQAAVSELPRGFERWDVLLAVQSALANGDHERAAELIEAALPSAVHEGAYRFALLLALHRAQVLFVRGEFDAAAHAAQTLGACAGSHADVLSASAALAARACLACGRPAQAQWPEPYALWDALYEKALCARADALAGVAAAAERAQQVRAAASALRYAGIEAHALGSIALAHNDVGAALEAWSIWLRGRHALQGLDLVADIPVRALLLHLETLNAVHRLAQRDRPQWPVLAFVSEPQQIAYFWGEVMTAALDGLPPDTIAPAVDSLLAAGSAVQIAGESRVAAGSKAFTSAAAVLVPFADRVRFRHALSALLQYANGRTQRWILRRKRSTSAQSAYG